MLKEEIKIHKNIFSKKIKYEMNEITGESAIKQENKDKLVININNVPYDADATSINYMSSVIALANSQFIQAIANGSNLDDAYKAIYKSTIKWKNANNEISNVRIESIIDALYKAMGEVSNIIGV